MKKHLFFLLAGLLLAVSPVWAKVELVKENAGNSIHFNNELYYSLRVSDDQSAYTYQLWKTDGTTNVLLKQFDAEFEPEFAMVAVVGNHLFFTFTPSYLGGAHQLWSTDGTASGTVFIDQIAHVPLLNQFVTFGNKLVYTIEGDEHAETNKIFITDGTTQGTQLLKQFIGPGYIKGIGVADQTLYFSFISYNDDPPLYCSLWKSDGTAAGTQLVPVGNFFEIKEFAALNGSHYFIANNNQLRKIDGSAQGSTLIKTFSNQSPAVLLASMNEYLYYAADDGVHGKELWKSDGTAAGTVLVKDINPGAAHSFETNLPSKWIVMGQIGNTLYFLADDGVYGKELWKTDGTMAGTMLVKDINPGMASSSPTNSTIGDGKLYFNASDNVQQAKDIWVTDGTLAGTSLLINLEATSNFYGTQLAFSNGGLYFSMIPIGHNWGLYKYTPTESTDSGTVLASDSLALVALYNRTNGAGWVNKTNWLTGPVNTWYGVTVKGGRVTALDLNKNQLKGSLPEALGNLTALEELFMTNNQLSGSLPASIGNMKDLEFIFLYSNQLSGSIPATWGNLSSLYALYMANNQLSGSLPESLGQLPALEYVSLRYNQLSGRVPSSESFNGGFNGLYMLDLSHNQFTSLPNFFGGYTEGFYVDHNRLTFESFEANVDWLYAGFGSPPSTLFPQDSVKTAENLVLTPGQSVELSALVGGANNRYQWTKNGVDIPGATQATLTVSEAGIYGCEITNTVFLSYMLHRRRVHVSVTNSIACQASGTILREYWAKVKGNQTSQVPVNKAPTSTSYLTSFEAPSNVGEQYASRIRGYLCAPETGNYTFWIASDDYGDLYLSSDENPANKQLIAYIKGFSNPRQWNKHSSQKSAPVYLEKGKRYYIEALHKEAWTNDNLAVAWRLPSAASTSSPVVIPGSVLSPFQLSNTRQELAEVSSGEGLQLQAAPNPFSRTTTVTFKAQETGKAVLALYDLQGQRVQSVFEGEVQAGEHKQAIINGSRHSQGLYLLRLVNGSQVQQFKLVLSK